MVMKQAAFAIVQDKTEVLLVANKRNRGRIKWSLPGGSVRGTEAPLQALEREVKEETGIIVTEWSGEIYTSVVKYPDRRPTFDRRTEVHLAGKWEWVEQGATDPEDFLRFRDKEQSGEDLSIVAGFFSDLPPEGSLVRNLRRYVREPLMDWRLLPWEGPRYYEYLKRDSTVERPFPPEDPPE
jgi:ADP-ribose pyrophosphatase YjhB (NUDIX family)